MIQFSREQTAPLIEAIAPLLQPYGVVVRYTIDTGLVLPPDDGYVCAITAVLTGSKPSTKYISGFFESPDIFREKALETWAKNATTQILRAFEIAPTINNPER